jgi:protein phosphatase 1K
LSTYHKVQYLLLNIFYLYFQLKHGKDAFLILTTDGITFVLNDQELIDIICCCSTPKEAASFVADQALQFGSEDNSTAVVIPLGAWGKYRTTMRAIPYSFGRNLVRGRYS